MIEKNVEYNRPLVLALVDFHKPFDTVELDRVLGALSECRIHYRYTTLIHNIYKNVTMTIRQGDTLFPHFSGTYGL